MNDQAKRWTAHSSILALGGEAAGYVWNGYTYDSTEQAKRLAACADLLRGVGDLSAVAVMTWADVEKARQALVEANHDAVVSADACGSGLEAAFHRGRAVMHARALASLPVPPKGDASCLIR